MPSRIPNGFLLAFGLFLFVCQLLVGTDFFFAVLVLVYVLSSGIAINRLGGLATLPGFCIAMMSAKTVVISQIAKIVLNQPGDSYLESPISTIGVLALANSGFILTTIIRNPKISRTRLLKPIVSSSELLYLTWGTYALGAASHLYVALAGYSDITGEISVGGLMGVARQAQILLSFSVASATAYAIVETGGRRSISLVGIIAMVTLLGFGVLGSSKILMYDVAGMYLLACIAFEFRFRKRNLIGLGVFVIISLFVFYPYAQFARAYRAPSIETNLTLIGDLGTAFVSDPFGFVEFARRQSEIVDPRYLYYGKDLELIDRFSLIEMVDKLVVATDAYGPSEWSTIVPGFERILPRFLNPDKPIHNTGNFLGHKIGILTEGDEATQIAFGFVGESYSSFSWIGVVVIPFLLMLAFLDIFGRIVGKLDYSIWAVFLFGFFQHNFVEATIAAMILYLTVFAAAFLLAGVLFFKIVSTHARRWTSSPPNGSSSRGR